MSKKKQVLELEAIPVKSQEDLEKAVYEKIKLGTNFRDITKTPFKLGDSIKHLNPSQISQIKKKFEPKSIQTEREPDNVTVFKLLKKRVSPTDIVIRTGISPEFVNQALKEFIEFEQQTMVPSKWLEEMEQIAGLVWLASGFNNKFEHILDSFKTTQKSHVELQSHVYPCHVCGKPVKLDGKALESAMKYIVSQKWYHVDC